jgi:hypothetical protein
LELGGCLMPIIIEHTHSKRGSEDELEV